MLKVVHVITFAVLVFLDWSGIPSILALRLDKNLRITLKGLGKILFLLTLISWDFYNFFGSFGRGRKFIFFFLHFEESRYPLLSCLRRFELNMFRLFRRSYFDYGACIVCMESLITTDDIWMTLLFFSFVRLKAKLNGFRNISVSFKSKRSTYTFMEIEILAWIFEVLIWNLHPNWIIIPQKKTLIFIADKSKSFFFGVCLSR